MNVTKDNLIVRTLYKNLTNVYDNNSLFASIRLYKTMRMSFHRQYSGHANMRLITPTGVCFGLSCTIQKHTVHKYMDYNKKRNGV